MSPSSALGPPQEQARRSAPHVGFIGNGECAACYGP
jgi:hypothetical protein